MICRNCEFEDDEACAGTEHAAHVREALLEVGQVADTEPHGRAVEALVGKG